jgi:hypothetical protein
MENDDLIREIATKAFSETLREKSQELAESVARKMGVLLASQAPQGERTKELRDGTALIAGSRTQTETLEALLAASSAITAGCGLLILRGNQASGWSCHGLTALDNFKRATMDCSRGLTATVISSCTAAAMQATDLDPAFTARLGLESSSLVLLVPVMLKERVAALLLAVSVGTGDDLAALELLVQVAQLTLDVQAYRKTAAQTSVQGSAQAAAQGSPQAAAHASQHNSQPNAQHSVQQQAAVETPRHVEAAQSPERTITPPPYQRTSETEPVYSATSVIVPLAQRPDREPVYAADTAARSVMASPTAETSTVTPPEASSVVTSVVASSVVASPVVASVVSQVAVPAFRESAVRESVAAPPQPPMADEAHEKARRFAKLLVEEIKLYNQTKVAEGRARSDLYSRLREDIEKSRSAYQRRYGESVTDVDYFSQELMRILADNNRAVMGPGFPG